MGFIRAQRTRVPQIVPTNLSNKTVLITGSNAGLGYEAARAVLPHKPSRLILAVRNLDKGDAARKELDKVKATSTKIETRKLDQSSFSSVRAFAKELNGERIDIALLNAGPLFPSRLLSVPLLTSTHRRLELFLHHHA